MNPDTRYVVAILLALNIVLIVTLLLMFN